MLNTAPIQVLHVAVNYNTTATCVAFVDSFRRHTQDPSASILIVVDNSDGDSRGELSSSLADLPPDVRCVVAPSNLGYFGGARFGLEVAKESWASREWTIVSNVDLSYDRSALEKILRKHNPRQVAAIAPRILSRETGRDLNPFMRVRPSRLRMNGYKWLFWSYHGLRAYSWLTERIHAARPSSGHSVRTAPGQRIYAAHGCFLILSSEYFARGGSLEHPPFLFGEEINIAEQARRIGLPIICEPEIVISHQDHASVGKLPGRVVQAYHRRAAEWIINEYFGPSLPGDPR